MRRFKITVSGHTYEVDVEEQAEHQSGGRSGHHGGHVRPEQPAAAHKVPSEGAGEPILAPLPGTVLDVKVASGETVQSGQVLLVLEAMKMENEIAAPRGGTVTELHAKKGQAVTTGDLLLIIA